MLKELAEEYGRPSWITVVAAVLVVVFLFPLCLVMTVLGIACRLLVDGFLSGYTIGERIELPVIFAAKDAQWKGDSNA